MFSALILACRALEPDGDGGGKDTGRAEVLDSASPEGESDSGSRRDSDQSGERDSGGGDSGNGADTGLGSAEDSGSDSGDDAEEDSAAGSAEDSDVDPDRDSAADSGDDSDVDPDRDSAADSAGDSGAYSDSGDETGSGEEADTGTSPVDTGGPVDTDPAADTGTSPVDTGSPPVDTGGPVDTDPVADTGTSPVDTGGADSDVDSEVDSDSDAAVDSSPVADTAAADTAVASDTADTATEEEASPCVGEVVACEEPDDPSADDDADGITNDCDYCPATPSGVVVNEGGCACEGSDTFLVAPGAGNNDGTDVGSVTRAMDTFVAGTSTGGWTSTNYGDATYLLCSYGYPTGTGRCFMRFELSAIPEDASIDLGTLTIYAYDVSGHGSSYGSASPRNFYASPVSAEWDEMTMTGLDQPGVDSAETSSAAYCAFTDRAPCELDVATILDYLRAYGNYGFRVDDGGVHAFTRYHTSSDDSFTELAPSLEITYTVP